jgi:tRNA methyltransferase complex GCD14 subunit
VNDWVDRQLEQRKHEPFLSYVFLDMPSSHRYIQKVATALKEDALIAVFVPSVTQIGDCVREIKAHALPLRMEKVVELGEGISNGRLWDVRLAFKRARDPIDEPKPQEIEDPESMQEKVDSQSNESLPFSDSEENRISPSSGEGALERILDEAPVMVCRPKVGEMVVGGGFVGLWRRIPPGS